MTPPLWKSTIVIWTDYPPSETELDELARDAISGNAYCSKMHYAHVDDPTKDPDWDGTEFFDGTDYLDEEEGE